MGYTRIEGSVYQLPQEQGFHQMRSFSDSRRDFESIPPIYGDNFSQYTGYDPANSQTQLYAPPAGPPPQRPEKRQPQAQLPSAKVWAMNKLRSFILASDIVLHSTPIMFIALALIAARLDGKEVSQYGTHLQQALLLSPTIFPVMFAALMGRCFKYTGLFLAERGTTLGRLEQLIGSTSLFSALERQISLRGFSIVGYILMIIWLLSPLGGQSALRLQGQESKSVLSNGNVNFLNPDTVVLTSMGSASDINSERSVFSPIFLAALLSSSKYQDTPMDLWGNVKLPRYRSVEKNTSDEWKPVAHDNTDVTYASLIGIPVAHLEEHGSSNFSVKARQWDITCDKNEMQGGKKANFGSFGTSTWKVDHSPVNTTCSKWPCPISFKSMANNDADDKDYYNYTVAACKVSYGMYETKIYCKGRSCLPIAIKKIDLFSVNYTKDSDDFFRVVPLGNTMATLPVIDNLGVGSVAFRGSSNAEKWMADPNNFVGVSTYAELYKLSPELLSDRLTILWNTFFQSTYTSNTLGGNLDQTYNNITQSATSQLFNGTASSISTPTANVWKTKWEWFTALLVSAIILQIASYLALFFKYYTCVPDIIGYASSMTLLNPYVNAPTGGTTLHGLERAHMLQHMPVMIGDVCPNEPVGAVAFAKAGDGTVARLNRKRFYV